MKRILIILLAILCVLPMAAQRKRKKIKEPEISPEEQARIEMYNMRLRATEQVTFIDSLVVSKKELLSALSLSTESGSVYSSHDYFNREIDDDCTVFLNQLGNRRIFSQLDNDGTCRLFSSDLIGREWTAPSRLEGLNPNDSIQNYPFMLSDGITLYYAAKNDESLGGYDIFMTRYDADEHHFLAPDNIGMPFNSEANDYLYAVDEFNNLGCFVTDRNQPDSLVCIYIFIPNQQRHTYNFDEIGEEHMKSLALIRSIADTQHNQNEVAEARKRLEAIKEESNRKTYKRDFTFILNDRYTYTSLSQFKMSDARTKAAQWLDATNRLAIVSPQLLALRNTYATASETQRKKLTNEITSLEKEEETLIVQIRTLEKEIRNIETNR